MSIPFVTVHDFTPNFGQWTPIGNISSVVQTGNVFTLALQGGRTLQLSFLSSTCFRVRFNPLPAPITRSSLRSPWSIAIWGPSA